MLKQKNLKRTAVVSALAITQFCIFSPLAASAQSISIGATPLFEVAAAGGMSASARAAVVQKNLNNALFAVQNKSANVGVVDVKGAPVITLGGYHVITVDDTTARTLGMSKTDLANMWADRLRTAVANRTLISEHLASIMGSTYAASVPADVGPSAVEPQPSFVHLPAGMRLPIQLITAVDSNTTVSGDVVRARLSSDVQLNGGEILPAGTIVLGHVEPSTVGGGAVTVAFDQLQLSNGTMVPISASVVGGVRAEQQRTMLSGLRQSTLGRVLTGGAIGAGLGAGLGTGIGAIVAGASRKVSAGEGLGTGAWMGAAIGGGIGAISGLILRRNTPLSFPAGQSLILELNAPAQVAVQGGIL